MKHKHKRQLVNSAIDTRFNPALKYISREYQVDLLQQHGASNRKHGVIDKTMNKTYKPFSNK